MNLGQQCTSRLSAASIGSFRRASGEEPPNSLGFSEAHSLALGGTLFRFARPRRAVELLPVRLGEQAHLAAAFRAVGGVDTHQISDIHVTLGAVFVVVVKVDGLQGDLRVGVMERGDGDHLLDNSSPQAGRLYSLSGGAPQYERSFFGRNQIL